MEAIVLAGGLGTRLRSVVADLPKPMAPIDGRPFLAYVLEALLDGGFGAAVLAVGYRSAAIRDHFGAAHQGLALRYAVEDEPLGTGGAIRQALAHTSETEVFVVNGDTYVDVDYQAMRQAHLRARAILSVAVHQVPDVARYGALDVQDGRICGFFEKGRAGPGSINAGVYLLSRHLFDRYDLPRAFSFEADLLVPHVQELSPLAFATHGTFVDIGVPEDYERAGDLLAPRRGSSSR